MKGGEKKGNIVKTEKTDLNWPVKIFVLTLSLSLCFGILSEFSLRGAGIVVAVLIIIIIMFIGVIFDMLGVAVMSSSAAPFLEAASRRQKGARQALFLIEHADIVSSFCCDIVGDVCSILSGSAGAAIVIKFSISEGSSLAVLAATCVSALIAALTVFFKAVGKGIAMKNSFKYVSLAGKILAPLSKRRIGL